MRIKIFFILLMSTICLFACGPSKKIQAPVVVKDTVTTPVVISNTSKEDTVALVNDQYKKIISNKISFTTFSSKVDVEYRDGEGKKYNVNAHIRMYKDSAIWVSVTAILGIEGLRAYITKDSVKLLNKQDKIYTARSVSYLQEVTELPLDLYSLQDLLIGNAVFLDKNIISFSRNGNTISLLSIGEFFKNLVTLDANTGLMESSKLADIDETRNRTCFLVYSDYENKKGPNFPSKRSINVSEKKNLDIKLDFKQYEFNETLSFPFSIPKNYTRN